MTYMLNVNGQDFEVEIKAHETLAEVLREKLGMIGVKVSCGMWLMYNFSRRNTLYRLPNARTPGSRS